MCSVKSPDDLIDSSTKENSDNSNAVHGNCDTTGKVLMCQLCNYKASHILGMVQHIKSLRHIQIEQLICLQRMNDNLDTLELTEVYKVVDAGKFGLLLFLFHFFFLHSLGLFPVARRILFATGRSVCSRHILSTEVCPNWSINQASLSIQIEWKYAHFSHLRNELKRQQKTDENRIENVNVLAFQQINDNQTWITNLNDINKLFAGIFFLGYTRPCLDVEDERRNDRKIEETKQKKTIKIAAHIKIIALSLRFRFVGKMCNLNIVDCPYIFVASITHGIIQPHIIRSIHWIFSGPRN